MGEINGPHINHLFYENVKVVLHFKMSLNSFCKIWWLNFNMQNRGLYNVHYYLPKGIQLLFNEDVILRSFTAAWSHTRTHLGKAIIMGKDR